MKRIYLIVLALIISVACTKVETGMDVSVTGFVRLINETGEEEARKGVKVMIKDSNTSTDSDENGKFVFTGLEAARNYSFEFQKQGYGSKYTESVSFIGNQKPGLIKTVYLYQQPSLTLENALIRRLNGYVEISGSFQPVNIYGLLVCFNDDINVSESNKDYSLTIITNSYKATSLNYAFSTADMPYQPGTEVYAAVYFFNGYEENFWDPVEKRSRYTSVKKAAVLKFTF